MTFFSADDLLHGVELWKTDGTALGTSLVADLNPNGSANPSGLFKFGSTLLFTADDGLHGSELWSLAP
jgi:ELWxxDGT repeat protein